MFWEDAEPAIDHGWARVEMAGEKRWSVVRGQWRMRGRERGWKPRVLWGFSGIKSSC